MNLYCRLKFLLLCVTLVFADNPCIPRFFNESSVCVCNATYCDTVTREVPDPGNYIQYTSSKFGKRFSKTRGLLETSYENDCYSSDLVLELQPDRLYQSIEGFGGAITDSAAINWKSLPPTAQQYLINSYFSKDGIEYNMARIPTGSTDFSTRRYTYNEYPPHDKSLSNFTLVPEDIKLKVPMALESLKVATDEVKVITAAWSPPKWMMKQEQPSGTYVLNEDYYQTYADYYCKFAELYYEQGIKIWALSPANEPTNPVLGPLKEESMGWTLKSMGKFLKDNLGPTIKNCSVPGIKLLVNDDQRLVLPLWFTFQVEFHPEVLDYIDGIAVHFYTDEIAPAAILARTMKVYPDKFIISTEACRGAMPSDVLKVDLGSWERAKSYIMDILENLNYNVVGWLDWNMCLNMEGGPSWLNNYVDSPIIVNAENQEFYKQPMYYAFGHFSKFIPRGSKRMRVVKRVPAPDPSLDLQDIEAMGQTYFDNVAFLTPRGTVVVVIHNDGPSVQTTINIGNQQLTTILDDDSITTLEFPYNEYISY